MYTDGDIRRNLETFYSPVIMPGGWSFDHARTLRLIDLYSNSRFETGEFDEAGRKKYFHNIVKPAIDVAGKFVELDTKNFVLQSTNETDEYFRLFVMREDFRQWMRDAGYAELLNELGDDFAKYGHLVVKTAAGEVDETSLYSLRMDPSAPRLKKSPFVYELLDMSRRDIRGMKAWDQDVVDALFERKGVGDVVGVYECYHQNDDPYGKEWARTIRADLLRLRDDGTANRSRKAVIDKTDEQFLPSFELYIDEVARLPYDEEKWIDVDGRWLGAGFVEDLLEDQMRRNEITNMETRGLHRASTEIYQSTEDIPQQNVLTDVDDGDILRVKAALVPLSTEERNLPAYRNAKEDVDARARQATFSSEISTGENLPANTPLGLGRIQAGMVVSYFDKKREKLALMLRRVIVDSVLPSFKAEQTVEHFIRFHGTEPGIDAFYETIARSLVNGRIADRFLTDGALPTEASAKEAVGKALSELKAKKQLVIKAVQGWYDDAGEYVDVDPTGEKQDVQALAQTLFASLTAIAANPAIVLDERLRGVFFKMLEIAGVSPADLRLLESSASAAPAQVAISNPSVGVINPNVPGGQAGGAPAPQLGRPGAAPPANAAAAAMMNGR